MDIFEADDNSTPLTAEEKNGLKLKWITLRSELNEAEAQNIAHAQLWLSSARKKDICSEASGNKVVFVINIIFLKIGE